jgi:hypothetical protein
VRTPDVDHRNLQWGVHALGAAIIRLDQAPAWNPSGETPAAYMAAVEATWWAAAVDEQLEKLHKATYTDHRDHDNRGGAVLGLRWARDRHMHQLPISVTQDGRHFPADGEPLPRMMAGFYWASAEDFPPADPGRDKGLVAEARRAAYEDHVQGRGVTNVLRSVHWWLIDALAKYEPGVPAQT